MKNKSVICNINIFKICNVCKFLEVNFSYSKKTKLKKREKKIEIKGLPNKIKNKNKKDNIVVEINLCLNS